MKKFEEKKSTIGSDETIEKKIIIKASSHYNKLKCSILQWVGKDRSKEFDEGKSIEVNKQEFEILNKTNWTQEG